MYYWGKMQRRSCNYCRQKIIDPETSLVEVKDKLFIFRKDNFYYPTVIGSSGTVPLYDKFKKDAIAKLEKIKPNKISFTSKSFTTSFNICLNE